MVSQQSSISAKALDLIVRNAGKLHLSSISAFEIGVKHRRKKLSLPLPPLDWVKLALQLHGVTDLPMSWEIAALATTLPPIHSDPFDRIIIATAMHNDLPILTPDRSIKRYRAVKVHW